MARRSGAAVVKGVDAAGMDDGDPYCGLVREPGPEAERLCMRFASTIAGPSLPKYGRVVQSNTVSGLILDKAIKAERLCRGDGDGYLEHVVSVELDRVRAPFSEPDRVRAHRQLKPGARSGVVRVNVLERDRRRARAGWTEAILPVLSELPDGTKVEVMKANPHPYDVLLRHRSGSRPGCRSLFPRLQSAPIETRASKKPKKALPSRSHMRLCVPV